MKRYEFVEHFRCFDIWHSMEEDPDGDWCRYEDVPQWVSVEERFPENEDEHYLVNVREYECFDENGDELDTPKIINSVDMAKLNTDSEGMKYLHALAYGTNVHITHWQSLPEPTEKDDD